MVNHDWMHANFILMSPNLSSFSFLTILNQRHLCNTLNPYYIQYVDYYIRVTLAKMICNIYIYCNTSSCKLASVSFIGNPLIICCYFSSE